MRLENRELLVRSIPPLAKRFNVRPARAWEILDEALSRENGVLTKLLNDRDLPATRRKVNQWWEQYQSEFPQLGLSVLVKKSAPKLPESTYNQLICLAWLTSALRTEQSKARLQVTIYPPRRRPKPTFWQRIAAKIHHFFRRLFPHRS